MSYDSTILAESNLVAYYELNETSGAVAHDSSSNAFNATISGAVTLNQTKLAAGLDACMLFDGSTGYISSLPLGVNVAEPFSVEMWIQGSSVAADSQWFSNHATGNAGVGFGWDHSAGDKITVFGNGGSFNTVNTLANAVTYYLALTVDASSNYTIYAGKVGTDSAPSSWGTGNPGGGPQYSGNSTIAADSTAVTHFKGYISSVAIYSKVLSQGTMNNHYTVGTSAPSAAHSTIADGLGGVFT